MFRYAKNVMFFFCNKPSKCITATYASGLWANLFPIVAFLSLSPSQWSVSAFELFLTHSGSLWLFLVVSSSLWFSLANWLSPCLPLALYGSYWLPLWHPLALTGSFRLSLALTGFTVAHHCSLISLIQSMIGFPGPCSTLSTTLILMHSVLAWLKVKTR